MATAVHIVSGQADVDSLVVKGGTLATAVGSTLEINVADSNGVLLALRSGASNGGVIVVEGLVNAANANTWAPVLLKTTSAAPAQIIGTLTTLAANTNYRYEAQTRGLQRLRLRVTTALGAALNDLSYVTYRETPEQFPIVTFPTAQPVNATPAPGSSYALTSAATTNAALIKNSAANLYALNLFNNTAATVYVKFYDKATAPNPAADNPVLVYPLAAGEKLSPALGALGERFGTGLGIAITGAPANLDATAVAVGVKVKATFI